MLMPQLFRLPVLGLGVALLVGCDAPITSFPSNELYGLVAAKRESMDEAPTADFATIAAVMEASFGTPDEPRVPAGIDDSLVELSNLTRAAGPQWSDQAGVHFGLYREHCATCHGVEGGGAGPAAALLNPYPRDFRAGVFKFKSTGRADKPTHADLVTLLRRGIPGTAMPSFSQVSDDDLTAIIQYVRYLAIRGETERQLIDRVMSEELTAVALSASASEIVSEVAQEWLDAEARVVPVPEKPSPEGDNAWWDRPELIEQGRELFHGPLANCASCHGNGGDGNVTTLDFDDWTKEYTTKLGISPSDRAAVKQMRSVGALRPRQTLPRKLQWNAYHGDDSDEALYRRLVTGIAGTPMPGLLLQQTPLENSASETELKSPSPGQAVPGVSAKDVWAIVAYLRSLATNP